MLSGIFCGVQNLVYKMGCLSVFFKKQTIALTKTYHNPKRCLLNIKDDCMHNCSISSLKANESGSVVNLEQLSLG